MHFVCWFFARRCVHTGCCRRWYVYLMYTHSYVWHDSSTFVTCPDLKYHSSHTFCLSWGTDTQVIAGADVCSCIHMCDTTHLHMWHAQICNTTQVPPSACFSIPDSIQILPIYILPFWPLPTGATASLAFSQCASLQKDTHTHTHTHTHSLKCLNRYSVI